MPYYYHTADVFTEVAFGGNPLAVLTDARGLSDEQMLAITREFNFSETVFVLPPEDPSHTRRLRIFTPGGELPFAGHPTVGTAFVLASTGEIVTTGSETRVVFEEGAGPVPVLIRSTDGQRLFCQLTAPRLPERRPVDTDPAVLSELLSLDVDDIRSDDLFTVEAVSSGVPFLFVPVRDLAALGRARVKLEMWERELSRSWAPEIYVFVEAEESAARNGVQRGEGVIRSRMFAPTMGIAEDPATGGAAAAFGGYLAWRSTRRDGMLRWTIHQGVEMGRPSRLDVETDVRNGEVLSVRVGGASVLVSSGVLHI